MSLPAGYLDQLVDLAIQIQQIPGPTFHESARAEFILQLFIKEGLLDVERDPAGNVFGRFNHGSELTKPKASPLIISAHLDTVFSIDTDLHINRQPNSVTGPGIGDNSMGVAALVGLARLLVARGTRLPGDVWLVANTAEEGLGNLRGMASVVERFKDHARGYVVLEGMGLGEIFHRGLAVERYRLTVETAGGHSWIDFGRPSAVHEISRLITSILDLPLPTDPRTSVNVGIVSGGTAINTIASHASLELDLRSEELVCLQDLASQVEDLVLEANTPGVQVFSELIGQRPPGSIPADHWLVSLAERCLLEQGITPVKAIGSTDANCPLSQGLPAICIGLTTGNGAHTLAETINLPPLAQGMEQLYQLVTRAWSPT